MGDRARDWFAQAEKDLAHAQVARDSGSHEWACFASQQAAEKAVKALHLHVGQEAWGYVIARLLTELPAPLGAADLIERGRVLDNFYVATRYANGHPSAPRSSTTDRFRANRRCNMPVRSLRSSVLVWPERRQVLDAAREWARAAAAGRTDVLRVGCFGSYARGDAGVGSDLDLVAIVRQTDVPFVQRSAAWAVERLPVPADLLVYTAGEWDRLLSSATRFARVLRAEVVWLWPE